MTELLVPVAQAPRRALLIILGGPGNWESWRDGQGEELPGHFLQLCARSDSAIGLDAPGIDLSAALARAGTDELRRWPPSPAPRSGASRRRWWPW